MDNDIYKLRIVAALHPNTSTREEAGMELIERYVSDGKYWDLHIMKDEEQFLPSVREAAGKNVNEAAKNAIRQSVSKKESEKLSNMTMDKKLSEKVRKEAGMELIELYVLKGRYKYLLDIDGDKKFLPSVRRAAGKNVEKAAMNEIEQSVSDGDYTNLLRMYNDTELSEKVREEVGKNVEKVAMNAIKKYVSKKESEKLSNMAKDKKLSEKVREEVGMELIKLHVSDGEYEKLLEMKDNEQFLPSVRKAAGENVEKAGMELIKQCVLKKYSAKLSDMARDTKLSEKVRKEAGMGLIELYVSDGVYGMLFGMKDNEQFLPSVREAAEKNVEKAVMNAIKEPVSNEQLYQLLAIAKDKGSMLSDEIKEIAAAKSKKIIEEFAEEVLPEKHTNPLTKDDGNFSRGTVPAPKSRGTGSNAFTNGKKVYT